MKKPAKKKTNVLSANAQKLLERIKSGAYYKAYNPKTPAAMQELIDARLVGICGRVIVIEACYVPSTGYTPFVDEKFRK